MHNSTIKKIKASLPTKLSLHTLCLLIPLLLITACSHDDPIEGYVEGEFTYLASSTGGVMAELSVDRGAKVSAGQLIAKLVDPPEVSQYRAAKADMEYAQAQLADLLKGQRNTVIASLQAQIKQAEAEVTLAEQRAVRYRALFAKGVTNKDALDQVEEKLEFSHELLKQYQANLAEAQLGGRSDAITAQKAQVTRAQAEVHQAQWYWDQKTIRAPTAGTIVDTFFHAGEVVAPGQAISSLLTPSNIHVIFFISAQRLTTLKLGDQVTVSCDHCKHTYQATVHFISPTAEYTPPLVYSRDNNVTLVYLVRADLKPEEAKQLHPGLPIYITFTPAQSHANT